MPILRNFEEIQTHMTAVTIESKAILRNKFKLNTPNAI